MFYCNIVEKPKFDYIFFYIHKVGQNSKNGRCRQALVVFVTKFRWLLVVAERWSLFRGSFRTKFAWADIRVVVSTGLTVLSILIDCLSNNQTE